VFSPMKTGDHFARLRTSVLCRRDFPVATTKDLIGWWEARRVPFNLIVGTAGILTCIVVGVVALVRETWAPGIVTGAAGFPAL
jgi:hypothetical protein